MKEPLKARLTFGVLATVLRPVMNLLMGKQWLNTERLPKDTGMIVAPNHVTEIDPVAVGHMLYNNKVNPHFLAKSSLFKVPVVGALLSASQQIPVERAGSGAHRSLEAAKTVIDQGGGIIVYPEGTLTRDPDLWPMKGHTGAARLALQTGAPLVPVAHWGAQEVLPRYGKKLHIFPRKKVRVLIGNPVDLDEFRGKPIDRELLAKATDRVMDAITELLEELRSEKAPPKRWDPAEHKQTSHGRTLDNGSREGDAT
ncbi:lysophospholipid acyltransferase family protein [Haematomicrobium sanguinis]|uniref:lysophospholipid acyltransferase family protein n=1 Tax=Haematomicrobium sanguinis TaxID=479106 RepID=UPI00047EA3DB|nr:lysophospholipid acyltransferase family protein [Haematomicrobium sanguinis]